MIKALTVCSIISCFLSISLYGQKVMYGNLLRYLDSIYSSFQNNKLENENLSKDSMRINILINSIEKVLKYDYSGVVKEAMLIEYHFIRFVDTTDNSKKSYYLLKMIMDQKTILEYLFLIHIPNHID
jgi:hypothetical protein